MVLSKIKNYLLDLPVERNSIISEIVKLSGVKIEIVCIFQKTCIDVLNNNKEEFPHCHYSKYVNFDFNKTGYQ